MISLRLGDCVDVMRELESASVDAVVTDPPYGINFMGKAWDGKAIEEAAARAPDTTHLERLTGGADGGPRKLTTRTASAFATRAGEAGAYDFSVKGNRAFQQWTEQWATEAFRVLKLGGHMLVFGGTRTYHRMVCGLEDAGFEIRDQLAWMFGSGFPKSLDVSKAIDRQRDDREDTLRVTAFVAASRDVAGITNRDIDDHFGTNGMAGHWTSSTSQPAVPSWAQWVRLRNFLEMGADVDELVWRLNGRKGQPGEAWFDREVLGPHPAPATPNEGTFNQSYGDALLTAPATEAARRWQGWGTALKPAYEPVVLARKPLGGTVAANVLLHGVGALNVDGCRIEGTVQKGAGSLHTFHGGEDGYEPGTGREYQEAGRWPANVLLDEAAAAMLDEQTGEMKSPATYVRSTAVQNWGVADSHMPGDAAGDLQPGYGDSGGASRFFYCPKVDSAERNAGLSVPSLFSQDGPDRNTHPTVKPVDLMRWLCRLVTPPGGLILDPFMGSGSTGIAAHLEGFDFIGVEREAEYMEIARARIAHWSAQEVEVVA